VGQGAYELVPQGLDAGRKPSRELLNGEVESRVAVCSHHIQHGLGLIERKSPVEKGT